MYACVYIYIYYIFPSSLDRAGHWRFCFFSCFFLSDWVHRIKYDNKKELVEVVVVAAAKRGHGYGRKKSPLSPFGDFFFLFSFSFFRWTPVDCWPKGFIKFVRLDLLSGFLLLFCPPRVVPLLLVHSSSVEFQVFSSLFLSPVFPAPPLLPFSYFSFRICSVDPERYVISQQWPVSFVDQFVLTQWSAGGSVARNWTVKKALERLATRAWVSDNLWSASNHILAHLCVHVTHGD